MSNLNKMQFHLQLPLFKLIYLAKKYSKISTSFSQMDYIYKTFLGSLSAAGHYAICFIREEELCHSTFIVFHGRK